jgi:IS1 family transposase
MANHLKPEMQVRVLRTLVEGTSVRSVERLTGVHRDTILRLMVRTADGLANLLNETMVNLPCRRLECDELWAFVQKKQRQVTPEDSRSVGDAWTWVAFDADTKLVPTFLTGKRDEAAVTAFIADLEWRLAEKVQISTDGLKMYVGAIGESFLGRNRKGVDYAQIIKTYEAEAAGPGRYSPPKVTGTVKTPIFGQPLKDQVSTSYVERNNLNIRMGVRRFTRLTNAFSKKLENHGAHVALWFAYYNFVKVHGTIETTPAVAAGVTDHEWSMEELIEAAKVRACKLTTAE